MAVQGLCRWTGFFSSFREQALCSSCGAQLLIAVAPLAAEHGLSGMWASVAEARGLSSCGSQVLELRLNSYDTQDLLLRGMWDLPGSEITPVSPVLAVRFFTTESPGRSYLIIFLSKNKLI